MTKEYIKKGLDFLFDNKTVKQIVIFSYNAHDGIKRLNINKNLLDIMLIYFTDSIRDRMISAEYDIQDYSSADRRNNSYYRYDLDEKPTGFSVFTDVLGPNIPVFSFEHDSIREIKKILIVISTGKESVVLYKDVFEFEKYLAQGSFLISKHKDRFDRVENDILKINTDFQIIKLKDDFIGLSLNCFEKCFKLDQVLKNEAAKGVVSVTSMVLDTCYLAEWANSDPSIRKQLISLKSSPVFTLKDDAEIRCISDRDVIDYIQKNADICGKIDIHDGKVIIKNKSAAKRFLKVLNDDYFKSGLTKVVYEILSKKKDKYNS